MGTRLFAPFVLRARECGRECGCVCECPPSWPSLALVVHVALCGGAPPHAQFQEDLEGYLHAHDFSTGHRLFVANVEALGMFGATHALLHIAGLAVPLATELRQLMYARGLRM